MKKFVYKTRNPNGELILSVPSVMPESAIKYECDCGYSAWRDTDENDDSYLPLPEYLVRCLNDAGITVVVCEFKESEQNEYEKLFECFLDLTEFSLIKYPEGWGLIDKQGGNLGNIESERFINAAALIDSMDSYISDYLVRPIKECLNGDNWDMDWGEIAKMLKGKAGDSEDDVLMLDALCNHPDEISLENCYYSERE